MTSTLTSPSVLSPQQIASYAAGAGATGQALVTAVAIALAESGGRVGAISGANSNGTHDRGLWQINDVHTQYDRARLTTDPAYNARAAAEISSNWTNFRPWSTFNSGAYRAYLGAAGGTGSGGTSSGGGAAMLTGNPVGGPGDVADFLGSVPGIGKGVIPEILQNVGTSWVKDLVTAFLPALLEIVFTVFALSLIGMGIHRLTGYSPADVANKGAGLVGTAKTAAAIAAV